MHTNSATPVNLMNRDTKSMESEFRISCTRSGLKDFASQESHSLIIVVSLSSLFSCSRVAIVSCLMSRLAWGGIRSASLRQKGVALVRNSRLWAVGGKDACELVNNGDAARYLMVADL